LEDLLSIFDQNQQTSDCHILNIKEEDIPERYLIVLRRLIEAIADAELRKRMHVEDEIISELQNKDRTIQKQRQVIEENIKAIEEKDKTLEEKEKTIEQKDKTIEEKDKTIEQKDKTIEEKDKTIEEKDKNLEEKNLLIKVLKHLAQGKTIKEISELLKTDEEVIKRMLEE
jgi:DNA repair exonuclease SbcCD ATPase subunit